MRFYPLLSTTAIGLCLVGCMPEQTTEVPKASLEIAAKEHVAELVSSQKNYFLRTQTFTKSLSELKTSAPAENRDYRFQIALYSGKYPGVTVQAISKNPKLRSFSGAVYTLPIKGGNLTVSQICAADRPSTEPLSQPIPPQKAADTIQCPQGSKSTFEIAANPW